MKKLILALAVMAMFAGESFARKVVVVAGGRRTVIVSGGHRTVIKVNGR